MYHYSLLCHVKTYKRSFLVTFSKKNLSSGSMTTSRESAEIFFDNFPSRYLNCCPTLLLEFWGLISKHSNKYFHSLT